MPLVLVPTMSNQPGVCAACGNNPPGQSGEDHMPAIHAEGVDINWGDDLYICWECGNLIADLLDRESKETHEKALDDLHAAEDELTTLKGEHEELQKRVKKILEGKRAEGDVKKSTRKAAA